MTSAAETILTALHQRLLTLDGPRVERNAAFPETVPPGGLIVLRDGDPGKPDTLLGGFDEADYRHAVPIEIYAESTDQPARDAAWDALAEAVGSLLRADPTLGGLAYGMSFGRPATGTEDSPGAGPIKEGTLIVTVDYQDPLPVV